MNPIIENGKAILPVDYAKAEYIIDLVCDAYNIKLGQIRSNTQRQEIIIPRQVAMYLIRYKTNISQKQIGMYFGKDHATVYFACKTISNQLDVNKKLGYLIDSLTKIVDDKFKS